MAGSIDTRTPELAYLTKPNIVVPKSDPRTNAAIRDLASTADRANVISAGVTTGVGGGAAAGTPKDTISGADPAATRTYASPDKEV